MFLSRSATRSVIPMSAGGAVFHEGNYPNCNLDHTYRSPSRTEQRNRLSPWRAQYLRVQLETQMEGPVTRRTTWITFPGIECWPRSSCAMG